MTWKFYNKLPGVLFLFLPLSWKHSPNCAYAPPPTMLAGSCVASQEKNRLLPLQTQPPTQLPAYFSLVAYCCYSPFSHMPVTGLVPCGLAVDRTMLVRQSILPGSSARGPVVPAAALWGDNKTCIFGHHQYCRLLSYTQLSPTTLIKMSILPFLLSGKSFKSVQTVHCCKRHMTWCIHVRGLRQSLLGRKLQLRLKMCTHK